MTADELKTRTKAMALRCLKVVEALPRGITGRTIGDQLARSATSVGANYRAACRARSRAEFLSKMGIVEEEADEVVFWLELCVDANLVKPATLKDLLTETNELCRIFAQSRITAAKNARNGQSAMGNRQ